MKKRSLWLCTAGALVVAVALAGCGKTTYFAGRNLPPSGLINRVMIAIQNPSSFTKGALQIVDAFYDIRYAYNNLNKEFPISGYSGALPVYHPEHARRAARRCLRLRRRQPGPRSTMPKRAPAAPRSPTLSLQHFHHPESELRLCRQPGFSHARGGQPRCRPDL